MPNGPPWTEAHIADMNGDGIPDVVVTSGGVPGITLYRGTNSPFFNPVTIPTSAPVGAISIADFDGDLVNDVVFAETGPMMPNSTLTHDSVAVSFGTKSGPPVAPVTIGQIDSVLEILPATEQIIYHDLILNPFVAAFDGTNTNVYLFAGSSTRQIVAPYLFIQGVSSFPDSPRRTTVGSFAAPVAGASRPSSPTSRSTAIAGRPRAARTSGSCRPTPMGTSPSRTTCPRPTRSRARSGPPRTRSDRATSARPPARNDQVVMAAPAPANNGGTAGVGLIVMYGDSGGLFQVTGAEKDVMGFDTSETRHRRRPALDRRRGRQRAEGRRPGLGVDPPRGALGRRRTLQPLPTLDTAASQSVRRGLRRHDLAPRRRAPPGARRRESEEDWSWYRPPPPSSSSTSRAPSNPVACPACGGSAVAAVAVGDFDGDAIDDLVVSQGDGLAVYYGQSYRPGGIKPSATGGQP